MEHLGERIRQMGVARSSRGLELAASENGDQTPWGWAGARRMTALGLIACGLLVSGCSRFRPQAATEYVYVTAKQQTLRDRVAAVSNRTGSVQNGDRLKVLEHGRRFLSADGEGRDWMDRRADGCGAGCLRRVRDARQAA